MIIIAAPEIHMKVVVFELRMQYKFYQLCILLIYLGIQPTDFCLWPVIC